MLIFLCLLCLRAQDLQLRADHLFHISSKLRSLAEEFGLAVVVVNQVRAVPEVGYCRCVRAIERACVCARARVCVRA